MSSESVEARPEDVASTWFWDRIRRANGSRDALREIREVQIAISNVDRHDL